jgi:hypothetical protein
MLGCSGAIEVASELAFVALSVAVKAEAGDAVRVGWLTDLCGSFACRSTFFLSGVLGFGRSCGFVGDPSELTSDRLLECPFDMGDSGFSFDLSLLLRMLFASSSTIVSTSTRFPVLPLRRPVF